MTNSAFQFLAKAGINPEFASRVDIQLARLTIKKGNPVLARSRKHLANLPAFGSVRAALITAGAIL